MHKSLLHVTLQKHLGHLQTLGGSSKMVAVVLFLAFGSAVYFFLPPTPGSLTNRFKD